MHSNCKWSTLALHLRMDTIVLAHHNFASVCCNAHKLRGELVLLAFQECSDITEQHFSDLVSIASSIDDCTNLHVKSLLQ